MLLKQELMLKFKMPKESYKQKVRAIYEIHKHGNEFYRGIIDPHGGLEKDLQFAYEGIEHSPDDLSQKLPNQTHLWNLPFADKGFLYASTMGHVHPKDPTKRPQVQEVYEFYGQGAMLLSSQGKSRLIVCESGDKVAVPTDCMMTLFNLSQDQLMTFDMANPQNNSSSKDILEKREGPLLAFYNTGNPTKVKLKINKRYSEFGICNTKEEYPPGFFSDENIAYDESGFSSGAGIGDFDKTKTPDLESTIEIQLNPTEDTLSKAILRNASQIGEHGIQVKQASPSIKCVGRDGVTYWLSRPLWELVLDKNKPVHRLLGMN